MNPAIIRGEGAILLAQPHAGTIVPPETADGLNARGQRLADTDWRIDRLYEGLLPGATIVRARIHRYVIDANRDPQGGTLYPGRNTTALCPLTDFGGHPIWREGAEPNEAEIRRRTALYHAPYHAAIREEIARLRARHRQVVLYDCHSIRSRLPWLFEGELPAFNIGDNGGRSAAQWVASSILAQLEACDSSDRVLNGRFRGGWTIRHHGAPERGIHAVQMELSQRTYMEERPPWRWKAAKAKALRRTLGAILMRLENDARI